MCRVIGGITEPGIQQQCLQPGRVRQLAVSREHGGEQARDVVAVPCGRPGLRERDRGFWRRARSAAASAARKSPAAVHARDSTMLSCWSSHVGSGPPDRALATMPTAVAARPSARAPPAAIRYAAVLSSLSGHLPSAASACLSKPRASRSSLRCKWTKASATSAGCVPGTGPHPSQGSRARSASRRGTAGRARLPPAPGVRPARVPRAPGLVCPRRPASSRGGEPLPRDGRTTVLRWPGRTARSSRLLGAGPASPLGPGRASAGHCLPAAAARARSPSRRDTVRRTTVVASLPAASRSAGRRSSRPSAASSAAVAASRRPAASARAAATRYGAALPRRGRQAWPRTRPRADARRPVRPVRLLPARRRRCGGERPVSRPGGVPHRVSEPAVALSHRAAR